MKRLFAGFCAFGLVMCLCVAALAHFTAFADEQPPVLLQWTSSNTSLTPPINDTGRAPFTEGTTFGAGHTFEFNRFTFDFAGAASDTVYYAISFGAYKTDDFNGTPSVSLVTGTTGYQNNKFTVTGDGVDVDCWIYIGGNNRQDYAAPYTTSTPGITSGNISTSDNSIVFLFQFTLQPDHDEIINLQWTNSIKVRNTTGAPCQWYCSMLTWKENITDVLYTYIVTMRDSLAYIEYDVDDILEWLQDHEDEFENLGQLPAILQQLTSIRSDVMAIRQSILQLFTSNSTIPMFKWTYYDITKNSNGEFVAVETQSNWYMAMLRSIQNLTIDITKSLQYQNQIDQGSTNETGSALESFLDQLNQQNAYGLISSFDVSQISGDTDISALGTVLIDGLPVWWTQGVKDMIDAVPQTRIVDGEEWVLPYNDAKAELDEVLGLGGGE